MLRLLEVLAVVAVYSAPLAFGEQGIGSAGDSGITLKGPSQVDSGAVARFQLDGLPALDPQAPIGESLAWAQQVNVKVSAPEDADYELSNEFVLKLPLAFAWRLELTAQTPGVYVLVVDWNNSPNDLLTARVQVGEAPQPPPDEPDEPDPPKPPQVTWKVNGLHVLVMDDENLRGNLPQSQINIFTSKPLKDWLIENSLYRFTSNDSLKKGEPARQLETNEFVDGWDLAYSAVASGALSLPVWIVSDGEKQILEPLPLDVETALKKLEAFK